MPDLELHSLALSVAGVGACDLLPSPLGFIQTYNKKKLTVDRVPSSMRFSLRLSFVLEEEGVSTIAVASSRVCFLCFFCIIRLPGISGSSWSGLSRNMSAHEPCKEAPNILPEVLHLSG